MQGISLTHHESMGMLLTTETDISSPSIFLSNLALLHSYGSVIAENLQGITLAQTSNDLRPTKTDEFIRSFFPIYLGNVRKMGHRFCLLDKMEFLIVLVAQAAHWAVPLFNR